MATGEDNSRFGSDHALWFEPIPDEEWRRSAACSLGYPPYLWDAAIDEETEQQKRARHTRAKEICAECPVLLPCSRSPKPGIDAGIWAGHLVPSRSFRKHRNAS